MLKPLLAIALLIFFSLQVFSQKNTGKKSLYEILNELERSYNVTFSYADDVITDRQVSFSQVQFGTLEEWLSYLSEKTGLKFHQIDDHFIAISTASDICGRLVDEQTHEVIAFATISTNQSSTWSDEGGSFKMDHLTGDTLQISHVGYHPIIILAGELNDKPCKAIYMKPRFTSLDEVGIQNYLVKGISKTRTGSFVMDPQKQEILPGLSDPDVLFTLQALPGIESVAESVSDINIRGGTNDQNLVLWDGIRMYQTGHFFGLISAFNPYITNKVTLIKNGTSAEYGSGVSGTILMQSDNHAQSFSGGAGANLLHSDFYFYLPVSKRVSVGLAARRSITDWLNSYPYQKYFRRAFQHSDLDLANDNDSLLQTDDQFYFYDLHARLNYNPSERDRIKISTLRIFNQLDYLESAGQNGNVQARRSELQQKSTGGSISYSRFWNERLKTTLSGYISLYTLGAINHDIMNDQELIQENQVADVTISGKAQYVINSDFDLLGGYTYNQRGVGHLDQLNKPDYRRHVQTVLDAHFFFAEANYATKDDKASLNAGLRFSHYPQLNRHFTEPRLSFNYSLNDAVSLQVLGELKNQTMSQIIDLQNDFLGVERRRWVLANDADIPITQSKQIAFGIHYDAKDNLLLSAETYIKNVTGISTSSQAFQNQYRLVRSTGSYFVKGMDILLKKSVDPLTVWLSYSLAKNDYFFPGLTHVSFPNNLDIRHHIFLGCSYISGSFQSSIGLNWHTGRPYTQPEEGEPIVGDQVNYQPPNGSRLDNYLRVDLSSTYGFSFSEGVHGKVGISIWNVANQKNIVDTFYRISSEASLQRTERLALGFTPNLTFRVNF